VFVGYFRFHRSKKILPGVRLNLAKSGPSVSVGVRGARVNIGSQGIRTTIGLPGSGLSYIARSNLRSKAGDSIVEAPASSSDPLAFMDGMTTAEKQAFLTAELKRKSIIRIGQEKQAFERVIAGKTTPLSEAEQADVEWIQAAYQRATTIKWQDFGYAFITVLVTVCALPTALMTENHWLLWVFIGAPVVWFCSPSGRRSPLMLCAALLTAAGLFVIGVIALVIAILVFQLK
jgi:Protein of unknown function (DUF4236)